MTPFSFMYSTEHCIFARQGSLDLLQKGKRLDFEGDTREHGRKPEQFFDLVRLVSPAKRLSMYGWDEYDFDSYGVI